MCFVLLQVLVLCFPMDVRAANAAVTFGSHQYEADRGETFPLGVYVKSDFGACDYTVIIRYDTQHLIYVEGADLADTANGALQITGSGSTFGTSIKRILKFEAVSSGSAVVYAESAVVHYVPTTIALGADGVPVSVPAGGITEYTLTGLAMAPVTINEPGAKTDDQADDAQTDNSAPDTQTDAQTTDVQAADQTSETQTDDQVTDAQTNVSTSDTQTDEVQSDTSDGETGEFVGDLQAQEESGTGEAVQESAGAIWTEEEQPLTENRKSFFSNPIAILIIAVIFIVLWIDVMMLLSRRTGSSKRRREEERLEIEEKLTEGNLEFADFDEEGIEFINIETEGSDRSEDHADHTDNSDRTDNTDLTDH